MKRLDGGGAMKVLILGASGFVGKNLLLGMPNDWDILATYYTAIDFVEWQKKNCPHIKIMQCNLAIDAHQLNDQHFDVVVSLLANPQPSLSSVHPVADYAHNATTVLNSLMAITAEKFIFFSSGLVYENYLDGVSPDRRLKPTIPYAISKIAAEHYICFAKMIKRINKYYIVRFWGAYGPYQHSSKIYSNLTKTFGIDRKPNFTIRGDGTSLIDAMHIEDTVQCILDMILSSHDSMTFDFAPRKPITIKQLVFKAAEVFNIEPIIQYEGESYETIKFYSIDMRNPFSKAFIPIEDGLKKLCEWYKQKDKK